MKPYLLKHCPPNPTLEYCQQLKKKIPKKCKEIISQGGGSTIDVGKWLAKELYLEHTAIPTTAGTGSEVTKFCVLTIDGKKTTLEDETYIPAAYVLDPRLLMSLPREQTISSGLDALSQAFESQWSKNATPESKNYSQMAINLALKNLLSCLRIYWKEEFRMNMLLAANFSGRAINITRTNICHAISYPLTEWYNIPHGLACGLSLEYFVKKIAGIDLKDFMLYLNLPKFEIDRERVADEVLKNEKMKDCPIKITKEDIINSI